MISRFRKVDDFVYRGSAPSIEDLSLLNRMGIKRIISLDDTSGKKIIRACKLLGIEHLHIPIKWGKRISLINFINADISKILSEKIPTFVHCAFGKDRTGLAVAMYRCKNQGWSGQDAIKEAKSLGFGLGVDPDVIDLYEKIIHQSCSDVNKGSTIVENEREDNFDSYIKGPVNQLSWSPYADYRVRTYPFSPDREYFNEPYETRQTKDLNNSNIVPDHYIQMPQSGQYDTISNTMGAGFSVGNGFL